MFGYVTKLLIPVTSVTKISKEKTVKIFPNAIAVCTSDERHVFSSFLSRETAYQLMISVWQDVVIHQQFQSATLVGTTAASLLKTAGAVFDTSSSASTDTLLPKINNESDAVVTSTTPSIENTLTVDFPFCRGIKHREVSELEEDSSSALSGSEGLKTRFLEQEQQVRIIEQQMRCHTIGEPEIIRTSASIFPDFGSNRMKSRGLSIIKMLQSKIPQTVPFAYLGLSVIVILTLIAWYLFSRISESNYTFSIEDLDGVSI